MFCFGLILIKINPIKIQKNSLIRVTKLTYTPIAGDNFKLSKTKKKPLSLEPICIGIKKKRFAKRDEPALIRKAS